MRLVAVVLGILGLFAATALFVWQGLGPVRSAFAATGAGLLWIGAAHFISMSLNARAWQILLPIPGRPSTLFFLWAVWLREAVNGLLPVARVGGEIVSARVLIKRGVSPSWSLACLVGDVTIALATQLIFTFIGLALLIERGHANSSVRGILIGLIVLVPLIGLLIVVQQVGLFRIVAVAIKYLFGDNFTSLGGKAGDLDLRIRQLYRRHIAVFFCAIWQMAGWCAGAIEIWLSLYFLNQTTSALNAVVIEALIQALSSTAFVVPGALGIQEGGFVVVGALVGLSAETSVSLALLRRVRDITVFVPALIAWQFNFGKLAFANKTRG